MRTKQFILYISILTLSSCVPKSDYKKLEKKMTDLEKQLQTMTYKYDSLLQEKEQKKITENKKPYITEEQALNFIKDYYSFYEKDTKYKNVELRRVDDNVFKVSHDLSFKKGSLSNDPFYWSNSVRTLTVHKNGKYDF